MFKGKISIIGAGFVGTTCAYTIMLSGLVSELVLIDIDKDKADGEALDLNHGVVFVSPVQITGSSDYSLIKGSDLVIISAGANQKQGESRTDLLKRNAEIFKNIINSILKYCNNDTILLVITNPVDILTYITYKLSGFDKHNVIGSGTVLDTARLKYLISQHTKVDARNIHTFIIGEHGDTEVAAWSITNISGIPIDTYCGLCGTCKEMKLCKSEFHEKTKNAAYEIIEKKGATYYAIALAVRRIIEAIIGNENSILTISSLVENEYGINNTCLSLPTIVNSRGADRILETTFSDQELYELKNSAETLKKLAGQIGF